jgi:hypothetical protein
MLELTHFIDPTIVSLAEQAVQLVGCYPPEPFLPPEPPIFPPEPPVSVPDSPVPTEPSSFSY